MNIFTVSGTFSVIVGIPLAAVIFFSHPKSRVHRLWAVFVLVLTAWGLGAMMIGRNGVDPNRFANSLLWWRLAHVGVIFLPVSFYHFIVAFLGLRRSVSLRLAYFFGSLFLLLCATPLMINTVRPLQNTFYYDVPGVLYPIFFIFFFSPLSVLPFLDLWKFIHRTQQNRLRLQAQWFFVVTGIGWCGGTMCFLPVFGIDIIPYGNLTCTLYPLLISYAIMKDRLVGINVVLARFAASLVVLAAPFAIGFKYQSFLETHLGLLWWTVPVSCMGILAILSPQAYFWIEQKMESQISRDQRSYQTALLNYSKGLTRIRDLKKLANVLVHEMTETAHIVHAALFVAAVDNTGFKLLASHNHPLLKQGHLLRKDEPLVPFMTEFEGPLVIDQNQISGLYQIDSSKSAELQKSLELLDATVIVPLRVEERLIGIMILGKKHSQKIYLDSDLDLLATLANQAALALENAIFFNELALIQEEVVHHKTKADTDPLTGLLTRRAFFEQAQSALMRAGIRGQVCSVLMIDLDYFKEKNDSCGHIAGDMILKEVATRILKSLRDRDIVGRYGGDEMIILLFDVNPSQEQEVIARLHKRVVAHPIRAGKSRFTQTLSIGVAHFPQDGESLESLIANSDKALYMAKYSGRNRAVQYGTSVDIT